MQDEENQVDQPSESENDEVVESPATGSEPDKSEEVELTKEQKRIIELKAQKRSLTEQKYRERQEKQALLDELNELKNSVNQTKELDLDALIEQRVSERLYQTQINQRAAQFNDACTKCYADGKADYADFDDQLKSLGSVGLDTDSIEFIADMGSGHKVLNYLAQDLEEADRINNLSPMKKVSELLKIKDIVSAKTKKSISNAPEPVTKLSAKGKTNIKDIVNDFNAFNEWLEDGLK